METVGQRLRAAREAKNLTVSQVAELTRIKSGQIKAIENDDFSVVPAVTYGKGFVKLFAHTVGLDPARLVDQYVAQVGAQPVAPQARPSTSLSTATPAARLVEPEEYPSPSPQPPEDGAIERSAADRVPDSDTISVKQLGTQTKKPFPVKLVLIMLGAVALLLILIALPRSCNRNADPVRGESLFEDLPAIESPKIVEPGYPYLELPETSP